jgi:hypothetical protein
MTGLRTFRSFVAIGMVVAFNLLMIALAAMAGGSIDAPFLALLDRWRFRPVPPGACAN